VPRLGRGAANACDPGMNHGSRGFRSGSSRFFCWRRRPTHRGALGGERRERGHVSKKADPGGPLVGASAWTGGCWAEEVRNGPSTVFSFLFFLFLFFIFAFKFKFQIQAIVNFKYTLTTPTCKQLYNFIYLILFLNDFIEHNIKE
jgi:hypothetical protein